MKVLACGICGTDLHLLHGMKLPTGAEYPVFPGHEVAAEVLEADPGCGPQPGARVVVHPLLPCGECADCTSGREHYCAFGQMLGVHRPGGLAKEMVWRSDRLVPADDLDPNDAALLPDAVATAYHALLRANLRAGGKLAVIGTGGVGTNVLQLSRALDFDIQAVAVVHSEGTAKRVRDLGFPVIQGLEGAGRALRAQFGEMDAVIDFSGAAEAPNEGIRMLRKTGRLVLGSVRDEKVALSTTYTGLMTREIEIVGSYSNTLSDLQAVTELVRSGMLSLSGLVSHAFRLEDLAKAFDILEKRPPGMVRVVITA
ncbi:MAG: alcohol dehydrogenase catalytic domain-containing protein [Hyphomonadaceae bacterium]|nr:alcohol dehydrogenase catalytic domain-containing protein [Hyphomonadaceae bacterium]